MVLNHEKQRLSTHYNNCNNCNRNNFSTLSCILPNDNNWLLHPSKTTSCCLWRAFALYSMGNQGHFWPSRYYHHEPFKYPRPDFFSNFNSSTNEWSDFFIYNIGGAFTVNSMSISFSLLRIRKLTNSWVHSVDCDHIISHFCYFLKNHQREHQMILKK